MSNTRRGEPPGPDDAPRQSDRYVRHGGAHVAFPARAAGNPRRARVFRALRLLLPLVAVAIVVVSLFWSEIIPRDARIDVATQAPRDEEAGKPTESMASATYSGVDRLGRPFTLTAEHVYSPAEDGTILRLSRPTGQIVLTDGSQATLVAREGAYDRAGDKLDLGGDVTFRHGDLTARSASATIDLKASEASGDDPVDGVGSFGTIAGRGFRIRDDGNTVLVTGPARMVILPGAKPVLQ